MSIKDQIRKWTPSFLLEWNRKRKKRNRNARLENQKKTGKSLTQKDIEVDLRAAGIKEGDVVLVHSSLSRLGHLAEGPATLVNALLSVIGENGTLAMPTSPNNVFQLNYIQNTPYFDVLHSPSKTGAITEYFRKLPGAVRSLHPTEPVSAMGPLAKYLTKDHFGELTPYTKNSPFYRVSEKKGKILYIGVTLSMAGTNLHTLEDAVDFKYPVYHDQIFEIDVIDEAGVKHRVKTKVHNPIYSKKRQCDDLIPWFEQMGVLTKSTIGEAETLVVDADSFFKTMVQGYKEKGITMYTPYGSEA
jgi:aminoglycoside 3-N-acetyltransferase